MYSSRIAVAFGIAALGVGGMASGPAFAGPAPITDGGLYCRTWIDESTGRAQCHNGDSRTWYVRLRLDCVPLPDVTSEWVAIRAGRSATLSATCGSGSVAALWLDRR